MLPERPDSSTTTAGSTTAGDTTAGPTTVPAGPGRGGSRWWQVGVWLFLLVGISTSVVGALAWHGKQQADDRRAFHARASDVAVIIGSGLTRYTDFVASLRSEVATTPQLDEAGFTRWIDGVGAASRYPGGLGYAYFERVPAARLGAFEAELRADPPEGAVSGLAIDPPGARASYCLTRFSYSPTVAPTAAIPPGIDVCAPGGVLGRSNLGGSSPQFDVAVIDGVVAIGAPVYAGGTVPATIAARRAAFTGWLGGTFSPTGLLPAGTVPPGMQTRILFRNAAAKPMVVATSGPAPHGPVLTQDLTVQADGEWTVQVTGTATGAGESWTVASIVLALGLLLSALLFGFLQVLASSRRRALRLVSKRTGELHHQALHDGLTGLPNRALILDRAEQMLARARRDRTTAAVLFMDLDGFKDINDTYGHAAGDRLLEAVAGRISAVLRPTDTAGRLGGDEFVVLVEGLEADPDLVAQRLLSELEAPFLLEAPDLVHVAAQTSIGIAVGDYETAGDLLRHADIALYEAKRAGGNRSVTFSANMQAEARERLELGMQLRGALGAGELFLAYQPSFSLRDLSVTGVEALIRWRHPTRGIVFPDDFIALAEDTGLILAIGRWVLDTACAQAAGWQTEDRRLSVAVNVSRRQLDSDGFVDDVCGALERSGLPADLLTLEIPEAVLRREAAGLTVRVAALKALGVRVAIDNFGIGYSSLTYLQQFRVDAIKIDRSLIAALGNSPESAVVARTLVQLGRALGVETLAAGVEERRQLPPLKREDCDHGQGFLFARPLTPEGLRLLLDPSRTAAAAISP